MSISWLTLDILVLFFPGILTALVIQSLLTHRKLANFSFMILAFVFGMIDHLMYTAIVREVLGRNDGFHFMEAVRSQSVLVGQLDLIGLGFLAIGVGFIAGWFENSGIMGKVARWLRLSREHHEEDLWQSLMRCNLPKWVAVRDSRVDRMYYGTISVSGDRAADRSIFMTDVEVYENSTRRKIYEVPGLYLVLQDHMRVEFVLLKDEIQEEGNDQSADDARVVVESAEDTA